MATAEAAQAPPASAASSRKGVPVSSACEADNSHGHRSISLASNGERALGFLQLRLCAIVASSTGMTVMATDPVGSWLDPTAKLTAIGVLALVVGWLLIKTLPALLATMNKMNERNNATLDKISERQHDDSVKLNETLLEVTRHCSKQNHGN